MRKILMMVLIVWTGVAMAGFSGVSVLDVVAKQRYPWNGLVDIVVTMQGDTNLIAESECVFVATNSISESSVAVSKIALVDSDTYTNDVCVRRFVWNATSDVGEAQIEDLALTVDVVYTECVKLWDGGPYWARCNVGASRPEECGYYFWWGDTVGYKRNESNDGWVSVKDGTSFTFSSSNCPIYGKSFSDLRSEWVVLYDRSLSSSHDAAHVHLGDSWHIPTYAEFSALISNCTTTWTTRNGVHGLLVTGKGTYSSKSIFLPAAGYDYGSDFVGKGSVSYYWSSTMGSNGSLLFSWSLNSWSNSLSSYIGMQCDCRSYYGMPVRPLRRYASE